MSTHPPTARSNRSSNPTNRRACADRPPSGWARHAANPDLLHCSAWQKTTQAPTCAPTWHSRYPSATKPAPSTKSFEWRTTTQTHMSAARHFSGSRKNPDTEVKKKAVFALSQLPREEGVPKLIEVAQNNRNREVRKQAMFWLGQSHDPRALQFFEKVLSQ